MRYVKSIGLNSNQPIGRGFNYPYDTARSSDGRIFVLNRSGSTNHAGMRIQICTYDEKWLGEFGNGTFRLPVAMAFDSVDLLYLTDEALNEIKVFNSDGELVRKWGSGGNGAALDGPAGVVIDKDDNLYVVEQHSSQVHKMSPEGESLLRWGEEGAGPGQFNLPWGVTLDSDGSVYVADWRNDRIQKFSADGEFIAAFGESGDGEGQLHRPSSVAVNDDGLVFVADWGNERVQVFGPDGSFHLMLRGEGALSKWAIEWLEVNPDEFGARKTSDLAIQKLPDHLRTPYHVGSQTDHLFWGPVSVKLDSDGRLYVTEHSRHRIQVYEDA